MTTAPTACAISTTRCFKNGPGGSQPVLEAGDADLLVLQETVRAPQILAPSDYQFWPPAHS